MSKHLHRTEPICLNCNAVTYGKFCHICGQENLEPKESFWHLTQHFLYDITHFDGKFFSTIKYLLFKPGFLSYEYNRGRRASYLNPIKMFVFVSAFFFFFQFTLFYSPGVATSEPAFNINLSDSVETKSADKQEAPRVYANAGAYKNYVDSLPAAKRPTWYEQRRQLNEIKRQEKYGTDVVKQNHALSDEVYHSLPKMMFFLLPFVALILYGLHRKIMPYYTHHLIFTVHLFTAFYLMLFFGGLFNWLGNTYSTLAWLKFLKKLLNIGLIVYSAFSMKRFYQQPWWKALVKLFFSFFLSFILFALVFVTVIVYNLYV